MPCVCTAPFPGLYSSGFFMKTPTSYIYPSQSTGTGFFSLLTIFYMPFLIISSFF